MSCAMLVMVYAAVQVTPCDGDITVMAYAADESDAVITLMQASCPVHLLSEPFAAYQAGVRMLQSHMLSCLKLL